MKLIITTILLSSLCVNILKAQGRNINYRDGAEALTGYLSKPSKIVKAPGVVVIHAWMGLNDFVRNVSDKLAGEGYIAFAADIYGPGNQPKDTGAARKQSSFYKNNRDIYRTRIQAAINTLISQGADPQRIAVIGYCFGGTGALEAARANFPLKGVVSFHGGLAQQPAKQESSPIVPRVLVLHGAADPSVPPSEAEAFRSEMTSRKADWQMIYYANAVHAFTEPSAGNDPTKGAAYDALADKRSWQHARLFLKDLFEK